MSLSWRSRVHIAVNDVSSIRSMRWGLSAVSTGLGAAALFGPTHVESLLGMPPTRGSRARLWGLGWRDVALGAWLAHDGRRNDPTTDAALTAVGMVQIFDLIYAIDLAASHRMHWRGVGLVALGGGATIAAVGYSLSRATVSGKE